MLLPELIENILALCSSKERSIICQVSREWYTSAIKVSSTMSPLWDLYYNTTQYDGKILYESGDYHLIVRLKTKYDDMYYICRNKDIDVIQLMITLGANSWNRGLSGACRSGNYYSAQLMIAHGAHNWNNGLYYACKGGHLELARLMISHGADEWNWGLKGACQGNSRQLIYLMISLGAIKCFNCNKLLREH